jgi:NADPH2:quinone reductase
MLHHGCGDRLKPSSKLLVHACGGNTGAMVVQLAIMAGVPASNIFGTCSERSMDAAKKLGIKLFNYKTDDWKSEVLKATNGEGVDLVLDSVCIGHYFSSGFSCLKNGGKYVAYGFTNSANPGVLNMGQVVPLFIRIALQQNLWSWFDGRECSFFNAGTIRDNQYELYAKDLRTLVDMVKEGKLNPEVGKVWTFEEGKEAYKAVENNAQIGKQVIKIASP